MASGIHKCQTCGYLWFVILVGFPRDLLSSLIRLVTGHFLLGADFCGFFLNFEELAVRIRLWWCLFHVQQDATDPLLIARPCSGKPGKPAGKRALGI